MEWFSDWAKVVGSGTLGAVLGVSIGVFLIARTCRAIRWAVPILWALVVLTLPGMIATLGWSHLNAGAAVKLFALPVLVAFLPMTGWLHPCSK